MVEYRYRRTRHTKKAAYNKWLTTREMEDREEYTHLRRETNKKINTAKNETWQKKCSAINCYLGSTRSSEAWKTLKGLRKDTQEKSNMSLITKFLYTLLFADDQVVVAITRT